MLNFCSNNRGLLTHLCRMYFPILINWTSPFPLLGLSGVFFIFIQRGFFMVWEINMGVCPRLKFDNIIFVNCLGYDFYINGAFEFLCNFIANL